MEGRSLPIYGDGLNVREWIFADEHSRAVLMALDLGRPGEVYNIGSGHEKTNLEVVREVLRIMGKAGIADPVRQGSARDMTAATPSTARKSKENGVGQSAVDFGAGLAETIAWYQSRQDWIQGIKDASYLSYYDRMYTRRDETLSRLNK